MLVFLTISTSSQPQSESADRYLSLPQLDKCNKRFKEAQYKNRNFFFSGHDPELKDEKYDWLDSRNTCRERCMETVSFETQEKFDFYKNYIEQQNISFIWTSGRLCDFAGCEGRWDLLPKRFDDKTHKRVWLLSHLKFKFIYLSKNQRMAVVSESSSNWRNKQNTSGWVTKSDRTLLWSSKTEPFA